jgi:hypothetical protein
MHDEVSLYGALRFRAAPAIRPLKDGDHVTESPAALVAVDGSGAIEVIEDAKTISTAAKGTGALYVRPATSSV